MDLMIPLNSASRHNNIELRYALRSFSHFLPHDRLIIVGECPEWLQNIIHIPNADSPYEYDRAKNIYNKIIKAFEISSKFIFANDDHFILQPIEQMPYHHKGAMLTNGNTTYDRLKQNTLQLFPGCNNFDTHCPIVYKKELFPVLDMPKHGIGIKTTYCVLNNIKGKYYEDLKINSVCDIRSIIKDRIYFSIGDKAFEGDIIEVLQELYPEKSRYEK